jgi:putative ABC transport system permease protein
MLKNYLKTALRNLGRNKLFSFINIAGLSVGLSCCILILLYAKDEVSFDRFHANKDQIYQLTCDRIEKDHTHHQFAIAAMVQGPAFKREIPEIKESVRVNERSLIIKKGSELFNDDVTWVDDNFFSVFSFPLISGNHSSVLAGYNSVVLTGISAKKYFGNADPVGKSLQIEVNGQFETFIVSGIVKSAPMNSSIRFNILLPFKHLETVSPDNGWMWVSFPTYFLLQPNANIPAVEAKMAQVYKTQAKEEISMNHLAGYNNRFVWGLQPFTNMHLNTKYEDVPRGGDPVYSYILTAIAVFILLIACINFINLTIAQSLKRGKEIGIRKVLGSLRIQLVKQFLGESLILCFISFILAIILSQLLLPVFNELSQKKLSLNYLFDYKLLGGFILLFLVTGFVAGFYPALVLSGFNPVQVLYNRRSKGRKNYLARTLVIIQFSLATFLIISTFFIYSQFKYLTTADLGYDDKNLLEFDVSKAVMNKPLMDMLKTEFSKVPGVEEVAFRNIGKFGGRTIAGGKELFANYDHVNENYLSVLRAKVLAGRSFSKDLPTDKDNAVLINESFAKAAGLTNPIGETIDYMDLPGWGTRKVIVIGLVKDFHFSSLKEAIIPQVFTEEPSLPLGLFVARISPANILATVSELRKVYNRLVPDQPFQYNFKSDINKARYETESRWKQIIGFGTLFTIFIACIGLFGLSVLTAENRIKEFGVRKVLGASAWQVASLISRDYVLLVFISFVVAVPCAWYAVHQWLQDFAYRISISWWVFGICGFAVLFIALLTVGGQALKVAFSNPINALRNE